MNASDNSPLLIVENVTKRFPGVTALSKVSLTLAKGEVLALIGENGAGKSTLMKILAGVQLPDEGSIQVGGRGTSQFSGEVWEPKPARVYTWGGAN